MSLISLRDATLGYERQPVIEHLNLELGQGQYLGLVGPNGSGKTTIIRAMMGIIRPKKGQVSYGTADGRPPRFGYMAQQQNVDSVFPLSALDVVMMGRYAAMGWRLRPSEEDIREVRLAMEITDTLPLAEHTFSELSGGQRQRIIMARALAVKPQVLLLDEPTNGLDPGSAADSMAIVKKLHQQGLTVVLVTHQPDLVARLSTHTALLYRDDEGRERLSCGPTAEVISSENLSRVYGRPVEVEAACGHVIVESRPQTLSPNPSPEVNADAGISQ